ncbi:MAG TPA: hypothetical protein VGQ57_12960 [Polyangiaceae bacterium]|jgi:hypothetical protein|nr:hypothetical protein [Polyangiaceae bacterium]
MSHLAQRPARTRRIRIVGRALAALLPLAALGCLESQQGEIYNMKDGRSATVVAEHPASSKGTLRASLPTGEACRGSFSQVDVAEASKFGQNPVPLSGNAEASLAVLYCGDDHVLRCTLARREDEGFSYGACRDRIGNEFSLLF